MSKLEELRKRLRAKKLLREQQESFNEDSLKTQDDDNQEPLIVEDVKEYDNSYSLKHLKIYCFNCKSKQEVNNGNISRKEIKPGSYRYFLRGNCSNCQRIIVGVLKNSVVESSNQK